MKPRYYFIFVYGCTDPDLSAEYETAKARDTAARADWAENGGDEHGIFRAMVDEKGELFVSSFVGDELEPTEEERNA